MRFTRKLVRFLVLLCVVLYAGAHLCIRIGFVQRRALESFSERAGYTVEASKVRFTAGLAWTLRDVRLSYADKDGTNVVFAAPVVTLETGCGGFARVPRGGEFFARRSGGPTGVWTPSQAQTFGRDCCAVEAFRQAGLLFGSFAFDVVDASVFVTDEAGRQSVFAGVNWSRLPASIPGHPGAVAAKLSYQRASGLAIAAPETLPATQWLELGGKLVDLEARPAPPPPFTPGAIGGVDGPTSIWLERTEPPSKQDMVEAFREFFRTDPETAKAFFDAAREVAEPEESGSPAESAAAPAPDEKHAESAEAPAPEDKHAENAEAPAPEKKHAESAENAEVPAPEKKHAESAENAEAPAPAVPVPSGN